MSTSETNILTPAELDVVTPDKDWSDSHALSVVTSDFDRAANYRQENHDWRWERADRRYFGVVPTKFWEGTNIPRAAISVMTAYNQVEALLPVVIQELFGDDPWFEGTALGKTTPEAARISREIIGAQLYESRIRKVLKMAMRSAYIYGNGFMESSWYYCKRKKKTFKVVFDPSTKKITDPMTGQDMDVSSGGYSRRIIEEIIDDVENRPMIATIPITQFYVNQNAPSTDLNEAGYTITRTLESIGQLIEYRDEDGYDIPDDETLVQWTAEKPGTQGDLTQTNREASRYANWQPAVDQSVDPYSKRVEVLRYKTLERIVWVVNRRHVIYNKANPYNRRMMQYSPFYTELIDRCYGMSITDVVDGEQLLQEGVVNSRLDELALALHPHTKAKTNRQTPAYQLRVRPGGLSYHDDPKNDMIREFPSNVTATAFEEVNASDMRVQKKTGLTDMAMLGMSGGANPGARSATGAGIQGRATQNRIQGQVENMTDEVLEPILHDFHMLNNFHLDPDQRINAVNGAQLDPLLLFGSEVRYSSRAAARMKSRIGLMQLIPYIMQYVMNPSLIQELAAQQKTVDFAEVMQMLLDATGYLKKAQWVRPMTPQEIQAMQNQKPSPDMIKWMMQKERMAQLADMNLNEIDAQGTVDMMKEITKAKGAIDNTAVQHALHVHAPLDTGDAGNTSSD